MQKLSIFLGLALSLAACSHPEKLPTDLTVNETKHDLETVVLLGTNDIHGALAEQTLKTRDDAALPYRKGGASTFAAHVAALRSLFGSQLLVLDAGDEFQGSIESNIENGASVVRFFNAIGVNAATLGNHEFDFGAEPKGSPDKLGAIKKRLTEAHYPYVVSNIKDQATNAPAALPNTVPRLLLTAGRLKVGVIGLTTPDTVSIVIPDNIRGLKFTDMREAVIREAASLRKEGAQIVIILGHIGVNCQPGKAPIASTFRRPTDSQGECDSREEVPRLLKALPPGTVDAVVAAHTHQIVHHWISGIPVIQAGTRNQYYNLVYLTYDWNEHKLLTDRTRIEGPVPICPEVFENQKDCNGNRPAPKNGRGDLVTPVIHGIKIKPDKQIDQLLAPVFKQSDIEKRRVVGQAARPIEHNRRGESALGNLIADGVRAAVKADVGLVNGGGIRAPIEAGPISYDSLFRTLPFDNTVALLQVSGRELKDIVRVAQNGARGFFPTSGLQIRVIELGSDAPSSDLNDDGKIEPWEINQILDIRFADGSPIRDNGKYTLATIDFLVLGGDDLGWAMSKIPAERVQLAAGGLLRDAVLQYISTAGPLNDERHPLIDSQHPRLITEKRIEKTGKKSKRGKKHRRHR